MSSWPIITPVLLSPFVLELIIFHRQHMLKWDRPNECRNLALACSNIVWRSHEQWPIFYRTHHYCGDALLTEILMSCKAGSVFVISVFSFLTKLGIGWGRYGGNSWCTVGEVTGFSIDLMCNCWQCLGRKAMGNEHNILTNLVWNFFGILSQKATNKRWLK